MTLGFAGALVKRSAQHHSLLTCVLIIIIIIKMVSEKDVMVSNCDPKVE